MNRKFGAKWRGSLTYEQFIEYFEVTKTNVSFPLLLIGVDI